MKNSIVKVIIFALSLTYIGCSKQADKPADATTMSTDSDVALFYSATQAFAAKVMEAKDSAAANLVVPPQAFLQLAAKVSKRYALDKLSETERLSTIKTAFDNLEKKASSDVEGIAVMSKCYDTYIRRVGRCDRDMVIATGAIYTAAGGAIIATAGTGTIGAVVGGGIGMGWAFLRHSFCVDDAAIDYKECSNP